MMRCHLAYGRRWEDGSIEMRWARYLTLVVGGLAAVLPAVLLKGDTQTFYISALGLVFVVSMVGFGMERATELRTLGGRVEQLEWQVEDIRRYVLPSDRPPPPETRLSVGLAEPESSGSEKSF